MTHKSSHFPGHVPALALCALLGAVGVAGALGGCAAMVIPAAVQGTASAVDRRSTGTQLDDQTIDLRSAIVVSETIGDRGHVNASSYSRVVLLTGEVPTEADRSKVEAAVAKIENVRTVVNELAALPNSTLSQRTDDTIITGKVKAAILSTKDLQVASISVITERGVVFLRGRVTDGEATLAANVTRTVGGVQKVVKVFEIITPAELAAMPLPPMNQAPAPAAAPAPGPAATPAPVATPIK
jgi:osmotically-inducible protein OsmY